MDGGWTLRITINLRVNKKTPIELYVKGSTLTKQGLGFPLVIKAMKH